ncbi:hypothetical protein F4821DRAFT_224732 [Hypoxylon rubiginosum]|uniref:Uncharacterized protein n=1 Tax=Hypoxylon rubiginosum TaxID=110542 RepID=A0ACC0DGZ8_9PEZI|nr:hypothetical protein F4821DRAFT_224732 [Hypoxylon rubiginosum]
MKPLKIGKNTSRPILTTIAFSVQLVLAAKLAVVSVANLLKREQSVWMQDLREILLVAWGAQAGNLAEKKVLIDYTH